jgi:hypothetical protein
MTVGELKQALEGVPDDVEVTALKDGAHVERTDVWMATYDVDEDESGEEVKRFTISC